MIKEDTRSSSVAELSARIAHETNRRQCNVKTAYFLASAGGLLGAHRFYLGRPASGIAYLLPTVFTVFMYFNYFSSTAYVKPSIEIIGIFAIFGATTLFNIGRLARDLYTMNDRVEHANERIEQKIIKKIQNE